MKHLGDSDYNRQTSTEPTYIQGNTVKKLEAAPKRRVQPKVEPEKKVSSQTRKNRKKALRIGRTYILFLSVAAVLALGTCINFLRDKQNIISHIKTVAELETSLSNLRTENDALYEKTLSSVDLEAVKKKAIEELGMQYATKDQVMWYSTSGSSYFRQYQDVPEAK